MKTTSTKLKTLGLTLIIALTSTLSISCAKEKKKSATAARGRDAGNTLTQGVPNSIPAGYTYNPEYLTLTPNSQNDILNFISSSNNPNEFNFANMNLSQIMQVIMYIPLVPNSNNIDLAQATLGIRINDSYSINGQTNPFSATFRSATHGYFNLNGNFQVRYEDEFGYVTISGTHNQNSNRISGTIDYQNKKHYLNQNPNLSGILATFQANLCGVFTCRIQ